MNKYEQAKLNTRKAEAEELAEFMEEFMIDGNPHVQDDEDGHWMTREEVIEKTRNSWKRV